MVSTVHTSVCYIVV